MTTRGVCVHLASAETLQHVRDLGLTAVRADFNWIDIQPKRGQFDWSATDRFVQDAGDLGLEIFATLAYTPPWANGGRAKDVPPVTDPPFWAKFVRETVSRYKDTVFRWGMWNEPNLRDFWTGSPRQYADEILRVGAREVHKANPAALVVAPDLAHLGNWQRWMREALRHRDLIDIISHHIYERRVWALWYRLDRPGWARGENSLRGVLRSAGAQQPVWLSECGFDARRGEAAQTTWYRRLLKGLLRRRWIERVYAYQITDDPTRPERFGLVTPGGRRRPAFRVYRAP